MPESLYEKAKQLVENSAEVLVQEFGVDRKVAQYWVSSATGERQMSDEKESLIGRPVRFLADFYTTRIMPPKGWAGTIEDERRSSSGLGVTSYIVLLDEPFRSQEQDPRVDATEDEMEPS